MRRRKRSATLIEEPVVNLTPLIDVVFVILFTFIVVAPLLDVDKVALAPTHAKGQSQSLVESPITIHVFADGSLSLNRKPITLADLAEKMRKAKSRYPQAVPQLFHDEKATFGRYQQVKSIVERAGFANMDVILKPT